jgi:hypothetical protein
MPSVMGVSVNVDDHAADRAALSLKPVDLSAAAGHALGLDAAQLQDVGSGSSCGSSMYAPRRTP